MAGTGGGGGGGVVYTIPLQTLLFVCTAGEAADGARQSLNPAVVLVSHAAFVTRARAGRFILVFVVVVCSGLAGLATGLHPQLLHQVAGVAVGGGPLLQQANHKLLLAQLLLPVLPVGPELPERAWPECVEEGGVARGGPGGGPAGPELCLPDLVRPERRGRGVGPARLVTPEPLQPTVANTRRRRSVQFQYLFSINSVQSILSQSQ